MQYYFAYGSNMNLSQIKKRCPSAKFIRKATLQNYTLRFTIYSQKRKCGCADVVESFGDHVEGLLFSLSSEDLKRMDQFEGTPKYYRRISVTLESDKGKVEAQTYEVTDKAVETLKPSKEYLSLMVTAALDNKFSQAYISFLKSVPCL